MRNENQMELAMEMADDRNRIFVRLISRLADHLAVEILAEASDDHYREVYVGQVEGLEEAAAMLKAHELDVPYTVREVIRLSASSRAARPSASKIV